MKRFFLAISIAALLAAPALADPAANTESETIRAVETKQRVDRPRRSTVERWRGGPVLRSRAQDDLLRSEALDRSLPPVNENLGRMSAFGFNASF